MPTFDFSSADASWSSLFWPHVHWPSTSYRSREMDLDSIRSSTSFLMFAGSSLIRVLDANLYLALFL